MKLKKMILTEAPNTVATGSKSDAATNLPNLTKEADKRLNQTSNKNQKYAIMLDYCKNALNLSLEFSALDILFTWVLAKKSFEPSKNSIMQILRMCKKAEPDVVPTYSDMKALYDLYNSRAINDADLAGGEGRQLPLFKSEGFYGEDKEAKQKYWVDIYKFFENDNNVLRVLNVLGNKNAKNISEFENSNESVELFGKNVPVKDLISQDRTNENALKNIVLFKDKVGGTLRDGDNIEAFLTDIASKEKTVPTNQEDNEKIGNDEEPQDALNKIKSMFSSEEKFIRFVDYIKGLDING